MASARLLIVEPWFSIIGHPAQSLLNTARVLGNSEDIRYLVSVVPQRRELQPILQQLRTHGAVHEFRPMASPAGSTLQSLWHAARIARHWGGAVDVFYLDAHLPILTIASGLLRPLAPNVRTISALGLFGPETLDAKPWQRERMRRWLSRDRTRLFLRTDELAEAWRAAFALDHDRIDTLPSLELPVHAEAAPVVTRNGPTRFGVLGQIRRGKSIEWLVPLFARHPELGTLQVCGLLFDGDAGDRELRAALQGFAGFENRFIPDGDLVGRTAELDYLVTLYDAWDHRLEAATFYLAARARRPVICYDQGWCGRMVREFHCGISLAQTSAHDARTFADMPPRDSPAYAHLLAGMERFLAAHSDSARRTEFLRKVSGETR
jgi:hypothetical protein